MGKEITYLPFLCQNQSLFTRNLSSKLAFCTEIYSQNAAATIYQSTTPEILLQKMYNLVGILFA